MSDVMHKMVFSYEEFEVLYKKNFRRAVFYCNQYVRDMEVSRGIAQDAFINLWEKRESLDMFGGNPEYYLMTIVRNLAINSIRKKMREAKRAGIKVSVDDQINAISLSQQPTDLATYKEMSAIIDSTMESMPQKVKEVFLLSREQELTYPQIAEKLGVSVKTVEYRLSKALAIFRRKLSGYMPLLLFYLLKISG
ncbi:MAG: RNA polymerase sigma-70 factor [Bacteroidia bacterium]|nr:RNA polymerase sigma-70 factor [Bacteroidia bacterium]